jgi:hypothetical protein
VAAVGCKLQRIIENNGLTRRILSWQVEEKFAKPKSTSTNVKNVPDRTDIKTNNPC